MLTPEKIKVYQKFAGDIDGWARTVRGDDPSGMKDEDWSSIDWYRTGLWLVASGRATQEFHAELEQRLMFEADAETRRLLESLATGGPR